VAIRTSALIWVGKKIHWGGIAGLLHVATSWKYATSVIPEDKVTRGGRVSKSMIDVETHGGKYKQGN